MIAFFTPVLAALLAAAPTTPSPPPQPSRLKVIVTVKTTAFCTSIRTMALPLGFIARKDSDAIAALAAYERRALRPYGLPGDSRNVALWSQRTARIAMHETTWNLNQNLALADQVMNASWKSFPRGTDANVDAMRQRLQNIIDLQRAVVNKFIGALNADDGCVASSDDGSQPCAVTVGGAATSPEALEDAFALVGPQATPNPEDLAEFSAHDIAHFGRAAQVERQLYLQEAAFANEVTAAGHTCGI